MEEKQKQSGDSSAVGSLESANVGKETPLQELQQTERGNSRRAGPTALRGVQVLSR